jgi:hypothetical protein
MTQHIPIPDARHALTEILRELNDEGLSGRARELCQMASTIVAGMVRRSPVKRARTKNQAVTRAIANAVWALYLSEPNLHNDEIGKRLGINAGRVSEVLQGDRFRDLYERYSPKAA